MKKKMFRGMVATFLLVIMSLIYYVYFGENKGYKNGSLSYQTSVEIIFIFLCGILGTIGFYSKSWVKKLWVLMYFGSVTFFLGEFLINTFLFSFMGLVNFRFINLKNFLISPFPYLILQYLANYSLKAKVK